MRLLGERLFVGACVACIAVGIGLMADAQPMLLWGLGLVAFGVGALLDVFAAIIP